MRRLRLASGGKVSNPLRLEGNCELEESGLRLRKFLIHYGWRGTVPVYSFTHPSRLFLIHYGWRGTLAYSLSKARASSVSNPLRLEGNASASPSRIRCTPVSNPLRLEGNEHWPPWPPLAAAVSNPLRLEGNASSGTTEDPTPQFLIHYGWRGTPRTPPRSPGLRRF